MRQYHFRLLWSTWILAIYSHYTTLADKKSNNIIYTFQRKFLSKTQKLYEISNKKIQVSKNSGAKRILNIASNE